MSVERQDVDDFLLREFANASFNNQRAEMARLAPRAIDKVYAEFALRGFAGFRVTVVDGQLHVEGITAGEVFK